MELILEDTKVYNVRGSHRTEKQIKTLLNKDPDIHSGMTGKGSFCVRITEEEHRKGLIEMYETFQSEAYSQVEPEVIDRPFQHMLFTEALRKLNKTTIHPKKIEQWVVRVEKAWRKKL